MKALRNFANQTEAHLLKSYLDGNGVVAHVIGAKDYASHVSGEALGKYIVYVDEDDFLKAKQMLAEVDSTPYLREVSNDTTNYFRRAVFLAIAAIVILPLVLNVGSVIAAQKFWDQSERSLIDRIKFVFLVLLQIPGAAAGYYGIKVLSQMLLR